MSYSIMEGNKKIVMLLWLKMFLFGGPSRLLLASWPMSYRLIGRSVTTGVTASAKTHSSLSLWVNNSYYLMSKLKIKNKKNIYPCNTNSQGGEKLKSIMSSPASKNQQGDK